MHQIGRLLFYLSLVLGVFTIAQTPAVATNKSIWSKKAVSFPARCFDEEDKNCRPLKIFSPDHKGVIEVSYRNYKSGALQSAMLEVSREGKSLGSVVPPGSVDDEIVWAPDSTAFFINGGNNANTDYHVYVYLLRDSGLTIIDPWHHALNDMIRTFPPCRALNPYEHCQDIVEHPSDWIGVAAIDWVNGSSSIVVMLEMNESSIVGGILGQVLGYEIEIPTGKILRRMEANEFAQRWQTSMAWKFNIPGPPEYAGK